MSKSFTIEEKEFYHGWWGETVFQVRSRHFPGKSVVGDRIATRVPWEHDDDGNVLSYRWFCGIFINGEKDPDGEHASIWDSSEPVLTRFAAYAWVEERSLPANNRGVQLLAQDIENILKKREEQITIE